MARWKSLPFNAKLLQNVQEACLSKNTAALENAYANEAGGCTRFPGLAAFAELSGGSPTYLHDWRGDLIAVSGSRVWRISQDGTSADVTGVPVAGRSRATFAKTDNELVIAAGGPIVRLAGATTEILSPDAPDASHVGYLEGYLLANEIDTGNFKHSAANDFKNWDPIDVFSADSQPDQVTALMVTPYRELIIGGEDSIEQFERLSGGDPAFARRWAVGEGMSAPYTLTFADNGIWVLNERREYVRASGQVSRPVSDNVGNTLEGLDSIDGAWAEPLLISGQKFIVLQFPWATNVYGTAGVTLLFDYRQNRWFNLFGWEGSISEPTRWPGWSVHTLWGRHFVGGNGTVYELKAGAYQNAGAVQRVRMRTGHFDDFGEVRIDDVRVRFKRGLADPNSPPAQVGLRVCLDHRTWSRWKRVGLGLHGDTEPFVDFGGFGTGHTFQVELDMTDAAELEVVKMEASLTGVGR